MTAEERQMRADRYARTWLAWYAGFRDAASARADSYAKACAELAAQRAWSRDVAPLYAGIDVGPEGHAAAVIGRQLPDGRLEIVAERVFDEHQIAAARARLEELRAQRAPNPPYRPPRDRIVDPGAGSARQRGIATGSRKAYAEASGDPGAAAGYRPDWLPETDLGRRR